MKRRVVDKNSPLFNEAEFALMCRDKKVYTTPHHAQYEIDIIQSRDSKVKLSYYKCPYCGNFHLTSK